ncbi:methylase [Calothrix sp. 336/3]|nr:prepilin-type N-terminal cleavage/methylation domain-containing protein [Calothrix sp. 336/3]AKG24762.1 methylase [Calothrix sp. 336/3]
MYKRKHEAIRGFTLTETLIVVFILGILSAIAAPSWLGFIQQQRLNSAQDKIYLGMRQAQSEAKKRKLSWQFTIRENNQRVQWIVHQADNNKFLPDSVLNNQNQWHNLDSNIYIDTEKNSKNDYETTLRKHPSQNIWRVVYNYHGCPIYNVGDECINTSLQALGQITLYSDRDDVTRRCVYVSTILGAMRTGKNQSKANSSDKYCY